MDVINVWQHMKPLIDWCREHARPALVDMQCYRFKGHSMSDPRKYRTHDEEHVWQSEDPIGKLVGHMVETSVMTQDDVKTLGKTIRGEIRAAVEWAKQSPEPGHEELHHDVYADVWGPYTGTSLPEFMQRRSNDRGNG
jgi:pyruvate dehydrogenase E1 component alpha subunit